ncbi:uncharacterized protein IUM83_03965 [Phytophthora cinnamomi]|uniref:uncharacterized protein n=1 Tax=Phytophthora cinnamomi TaxID=4785 RepID=UPI002A260BCA|nr:hypothetical protein IUM83_03965 [Phytophthora cinnamomi]KAJ8571673.1 hypothetical protein ON010_g5164 [Phytophthora cinnamomi]
MDSNNKLPATTPAAKPGLSIQPAIDANSSNPGAKFAQKAGEVPPPSNQDSDGSSDEARKSALAKQFIESQSITGLGRLLSRR